MILNEKCLVYQSERGHSELWLLEDIFHYMSTHAEDDPLGIMNNKANYYALERAKAYALQKERREKYARDDPSSNAR